MKKPTHVRMDRRRDKFWEVRVITYPGGVILTREGLLQRRMNATLSIPAEFWCELDPWLKEEVLMSFLKRGRPDNGLNGQGGYSHDSDFADRYPALSEYMTALAYPDGSARRTSTLNVFVDRDGWKASLKDRDNGLILFATDRSFLGVLEALEGLLISEHPPWREDRYPGQGQNGGGKKKP